MADFITTLTAAALSMCSGMCAPLERSPTIFPSASIGLVERYFVDPGSPLLAVTPAHRFDYARACFTIRGPAFAKGPLTWCESNRIDSTDRTLGLTWWRPMDDRESDQCVLVANSRRDEPPFDEQWLVEHYVCREAGVS